MAGILLSSPTMASSSSLGQGEQLLGDHGELQLAYHGEQLTGYHGEPAYHGEQLVGYRSELAYHGELQLASMPPLGLEGLPWRAL